MSELIVFATPRKTSRAGLMNAWLSGGELRLYTADAPASADVAIGTQILLATLMFPDPVGTTTEGVITADAMPGAMIAADGVAAWARAVDSTGATIADFAVGLVGSGQAVILDNLSLVTGALVSLTAFVYAEG